MNDQEYTCFDEVHFDDSQEYPTLMGLNLTTGCWITFGTKLTELMCP